MTILNSIPALIIGLLLGAGACWYFLRGQIAKYHEGRQAHMQQQLSDQHEKITRYEQSHIDSQRELARLEERIAAETRTRTQLPAEFKALAQQLLDAQSKQFAGDSSTHLGKLLDPLNSQLDAFKKQIEAYREKEIVANTQLSAELKNLRTLNERLSQDALNLTNALKGENKTQGNWGEMVLERILEDAGLREGHEFDRQVQLTDDEGKRQIPDVILHLPNQGDLVIDAKVSLSAYEAAMTAENDTSAYRAARQQHVQSIHQHIKSLSGKSYAHLKMLHSPDFVLLFVPIESALSLALRADPTLQESAFDRGIILVSPTTLMLACRIVKNIWRSEAQNENAQEIAKQAGDMLDKLSGFTHDLENIGKHIAGTQKAYDQAQTKISGRGGLLSRAEKIQQLGIKGKKTLPTMQPQAYNTNQLTDESETP